MITETGAQDLLSGLSESINKMFFETWREVHAAGLPLRPRGRANVMWDVLTQKAKNAWVGDESPLHKINDKKLTVDYWLNESVLFRFKKSDHKGFSSNYPTQTAMNFHNTQMTLFDKESHLEIGYVLNKPETEIVDILVIHRKGSRIDFAFSILDGAAPVHVPVKTPQPDTGQSAGIVRLKNSGKESREEDGQT